MHTNDGRDTKKVDDREREREREREQARQDALRAAEGGTAPREGPPSGPSGGPGSAAANPGDRPGDSHGDRASKPTSDREIERERARREFLKRGAPPAPGDDHSNSAGSGVGMPTPAAPDASADAGGIVGAVRGIEDEAVLRAVIAAARDRIDRLGLKTVAETRVHGAGRLQLEYRSNRTPGAAPAPRRGPYWYYRWYEGGRQRSLYLGKTEDPEGDADRKLAERERQRDP